MISKETILNKTHYGLRIYSHILRLYYTNEVVLRLTGRDCDLCRNPFNANKETLHIFIEKENILGNALDNEYARHEDSANAIPTGDAFDFAELHYKQQGEELLQTLNKELNLKIGEKTNFISQNHNNRNHSNHNNLTNHTPDRLFSFYKSPITNIKPYSKATLRQVYNAIVGDYYKATTAKLRAISDVAQARLFKAANFDYCTFSGVFTTRNDKALIKHSGLLCLDFDNLKNVRLLRNQLLKDEYFDTQLIFISPSGNGLKWIISIDIATTLNNTLVKPAQTVVEPVEMSTQQKIKTAHSEYFSAVANYILQTYGVAVDKSGRDLSRACFLPHDPQAFINPVYLK
ncbi:MAG TPA: BT4734/BF3469 family protein [Salinivirgaceae bacterium]|nr:BT4734/BF3469 family protein [Salinivirgaceae bacterium]